MLSVIRDILKEHKIAMNVSLNLNHIGFCEFTRKIDDVFQINIYFKLFAVSLYILKN